MKRFAFAFGCVLASLPGICSAALQLEFGPRNPPSPTPLYPVDALGRHYFDLVFTETGPGENEGLFAYDVLLNLVGPGNGARLTGIERPPDNFVLDVPSGSTFSVAESDARHVLVNVSSNNELADINTGDKAARVFYEVDPGVRGQNYRIVFDTASTVFGSGDPNREVNIAVDLTGDATLPEPAGLCLLGGVVLFALRRRRR